MNIEGPPFNAFNNYCILVIHCPACEHVWGAVVTVVMETHLVVILVVTVTSGVLGEGVYR